MSAAPEEVAYSDRSRSGDVASLPYHRLFSAVCVALREEI
jgi:hypothetical protein